MKALICFFKGHHWIVSKDDLTRDGEVDIVTRHFSLRSLPEDKDDECRDCPESIRSRLWAK